MKKIILFLLLVSAQSAIAQNETTTIKKDFETMIRYTREKKINEIMEMTYPKLFQVIPKEKMAAMVKTGLDGAGMKMIYEANKTNLHFSKIAKLKASTVCLAKYDQNMVIEFTDPKMAQMFLKAKSKDLIPEKLSDKKVRLKGKSYLLAIKDAYTKNTWKYVNYNDLDQELNNKILSAEIKNSVVQLKSELDKG